MYIVFIYIHAFHRLLTDPTVEWAKALGVLNTSLQLSKVIIKSIDPVEAEILLNIGQYSRRHSHVSA